MRQELGWEFIQIYGLTETAPLVTINRDRREYESLDEEGSKQRFWRSFKVLGEWYEDLPPY